MSEAENIARALKGRKSGRGWIAHCPCPNHGHGDKNPSLSITDGDDGKLLLKCHKGGTFDEVMATLRARGLVETRPPHQSGIHQSIKLFAATAARPAPADYSLEETFDMPKAKTYDFPRKPFVPSEWDRHHIYTDESGAPVRLVAVKRLSDADKMIRQFGMLPDGAWDMDADKGPMVPYQLLALLESPITTPVFICEGEKDVDTLASLGHLATTNPNGATSWNNALNKYISGRDVIIVPDADTTGVKRVADLHGKLRGTVASFRVVSLGLEIKEKHGEDITDWIEAGHTGDEFIELAGKAAEYGPKQEEPNRRHKFETLADLRALPPTRDLIERYIPERSTGLLIGKWGTRKTFIAFDWTLHLCYGLPDWHGWKLPGKPSDCLIIAREGAAGFVKRIDAFKAHHNIDDDPSNLVFMRAPVSFADDAAFAELKEDIKRLDRPFGFALVDTVGRAIPGVDMAKEQYVTLFMERLQQVGEVTEGTAIGVHHENKSGDATGSMYFQNNSDFMLSSTKEEAGDRLLGKITCLKSKEDGDQWSQCVEYKKIDLPDGKSSLVVDSVFDEEKSQTGNPARPVSNRSKLALHALDEAVLSYGEPAPPSLYLYDVKAVRIERWRDELFARGIIDREAKNPRTDLKRIKDALAASSLVGERDGLVWRAK